VIAPTTGYITAITAKTDLSAFNAAVVIATRDLLERRKQSEQPPCINKLFSIMGTYPGSTIYLRPDKLQIRKPPNL
jgi:hypothetical protein